MFDIFTFFNYLIQNVLQIENLLRFGGACGVTAIVVRNRLGEPSSNCG